MRHATPAVAFITLITFITITAPAASADGLGRPVAVAGRVWWCGAGPCPPRPGEPPPAPPVAPADSALTAFARGDSLAGWAARAADPRSSPVALREVARIDLAAGRLGAADSALGSPRLAASVWAWEALRLRVDAWTAAGDTARAESLLAGADVSAWPDGDRAGWHWQRARLAAARSRTEAAEELARLTLRLFPSLAPAAHALALLDSLARAGGDSLSVADERAGAEVDAFRGARGAAARRLRHARPREIEGERWKLALRLAEVLRDARMPLGARAAAETALALAPDGEARAKAALERARAWRDAGSTDSALAAFARLGRSAAGATLRATAWWEYAREAEDESRWTQALEGFRHVAQSGERRADDARVRAGLVQFVRGEPDSARQWWRRSTSEAARFWLGVSLRATDRVASDSLLGAIAALPGYGFYRAAARDTLGLRGWRQAVAALPPADTADGGRDNELLRWGLADDAMLELSRWASSGRPGTEQWLQAAAWAYEAGRPGPGTRHAERAFSSATGGPDDSLAWAVAPWAYPPAYEPEVVASESLGVERSLLWALIRQESRFEPRARSRSDALGLTQLKLATAGDAAKWLHEPPPTEETLFTPGPSVRYGARYLAQLLRRFDLVVPVALAAYNAGPGTARPDWRALVARGGEACFAEFASNADSQDYVKRILGFRQAYRELRPTGMP